MAYAHDIHTDHGPSLLQRIGAGIMKAMEAMMDSSHANQCRLEAERLNKLSDAQLAEIGLERDQIMMRAFGRYMYM